MLIAFEHLIYHRRTKKHNDLVRKTITEKESKKDVL